MQEIHGFMLLRHGIDARPTLQKPRMLGHRRQLAQLVGLLRQMVLYTGDWEGMKRRAHESATTALGLKQLCFRLEEN